MDLKSKIMNIEEVTNGLGYSEATIDRWCEETRHGLNDFPLPFTQKKRRRLWTADAIEEWVERRQSAAQTPVNVPAVRRTKAVAEERQRRQEATERALERHGLGRKQKGGGMSK